MEQLQLGDHVCAFVDGVDDRLDLIAPLVAAGLDAGEKVMVFTESLLPVAVLAGLTSRGVAIRPAQRAGQVQILPARQAYLPSGRFVPARMLEALVGHINQAAAENYTGLRLVGDMEWALDEPAAMRDLVSYEAQVNRLFLDGRALGVCLYDRRFFPTGVLRQVACAHPATTTQGAGWAPLLRMRRTTAPYGLRLVGEADISNRQALTVALDAVLDEQPDPAVPITIDVAGLRFADAATAAVLGSLTLRAPAGVHLTGSHPPIETILNRLGVTQLSKMRLSPAVGAISDGGGTAGTEMLP